MTKKLFGFINTKALLLFHYFPLTAFVFLAYWLSVKLKLMELVASNPVLGWTSLFLLYYLVLLIADNLIHKAIGED